VNTFLRVRAVLKSAYETLCHEIEEKVLQVTTLKNLTFPENALRVGSIQETVLKMFSMKEILMETFLGETALLEHTWKETVLVEVENSLQETV